MASSSSSGPPPLPETDDPFELLGLNIDKNGVPSKKDIKRAYKRRAMMYHPDMVCSASSTAEEKRNASDTFARIVAAYEQLSSKGDTAGARGSSSSRSSSNTGTGSGTGSGWTPPHRRAYTNTSTKNRSAGSTSSAPRWEDFMPDNEEDEKYDAGGDSFEAIFRDLVTGMATSQTGGSILSEFLDFLENTSGAGFAYPASSSSSSSRRRNDDGQDDEQLQQLLRTGTLQQVREEMEDAQLLMDQLKQKEANLQMDIAAATAATSTLSQQEQLEEANARLQIVQQYQRRAKNRYMQLQMRYKQLRSNNQYTNDYNTNDYNTNTDTATSSSSSSTTRDSFGSSYGRRRGSGRRRNNPNTNTGTTSTNSANASRTQTTTTTTTSSYTQPSSRQTSNYSGSSRNSSTNYSTRTNTIATTRTNNESNIPPHRRSTTSYTKSDKQRLREIKVDEEFDKLKKELGL